MSDIEILKSKELALCGSCKRTFNSSNLQPKYLKCKHYFCLECLQNEISKGSQTKSNEIFCLNCYKLTDLSEGGPECLETYEPALALAKYFLKASAASSASLNGINGSKTEEKNLDDLETHNEKCHIHGLTLNLWCTKCRVIMCIECANEEHSDVERHTIWTKDEMTEQANKMIIDMITLDGLMQQLSSKQRQFLIMVRNALAAMEQVVQTNLDNLEAHWSANPQASEIRRYLSRTEVLINDATTPRDFYPLLEQLHEKHDSLQNKYREMIVFCQLNELVGNSLDILNSETLRQAVHHIIEGQGSSLIPMPPPRLDPVLFLANYCLSQLYNRPSTVIDTNLQNGGTSAHQEHIETQPGIPLNELSSKLNGHILHLSDSSDDALISEPLRPSTSPALPILTTQPTIPAPDIPASEIPARPIFTPSPDIPDHYSIASSSATPQRVNSPPPIIKQEESRMSPTQRTSAAQMYPIEYAEALEPPSTIFPQPKLAKMKPLTNVFPRYFFNVEINGVLRGRFVIETCPEAAPRMCRNFDRLATQEGKMSYRGCCFFQCWKNESVITGDYELNNGRGGKSIYEDNFFMPDETRFPAIRGAVGMRRQQKVHENFGKVGSVFRILLQDMQGFTGIFGHVVEGIEFIDKIAGYGDQTGKPTKSITITKCGKLESK